MYSRFEDVVVLEVAKSLQLQDIKIVVVLGEIGTGRLLIGPIRAQLLYAKSPSMFCARDVAFRSLTAVHRCVAPMTCLL